MMSVEQSVEFLAGETELFGENLPQFHFVHHESHITWPGQWLCSYLHLSTVLPNAFQCKSIPVPDNFASGWGAMYFRIHE
jgi:hypothetical protein